MSGNEVILLAPVSGVIYPLVSDPGFFAETCRGRNFD